MCAKLDQKERIEPIASGRSKSSQNDLPSEDSQPSEPADSLQTTTGDGRNGTSAWATPTGPAPAPPPPCGIENVLCRLRCMRSKPMSPGRELPISALAFAPS